MRAAASKAVPIKARNYLPCGYNFLSFQVKAHSVPAKGGAS
jgi:hypothetical protein